MTVGVVNVMFIVLMVLTTFSMMTWVVVTVCRICLPETPPPLDEPVEEAGKRYVGTHEIYLTLRRKARCMHETYSYAGGYSEGLPREWQDDLVFRRN